MSHRFEYARAAGETELFLVFPEGAYESLPFEIRLMARWTGAGFGSLSALKPTHRCQLHKDGFAVLREVAGLMGAVLAADKPHGSDASLQQAA
jgi:hypothetical protein